MILIREIPHNNKSENISFFPESSNEKWEIKGNYQTTILLKLSISKKITEIILQMIASVHILIRVIYHKNKSEN